MTQADFPDLDVEHLGLYTMNDRSLQAELFKLFFDQMPLYIDQMREGLTSGNHHGWRAAAHAIKGSALALGLMNLSELARVAEKSAPTEAQLVAVEQAMATARRASEAYLKGVAA